MAETCLNHETSDCVSAYTPLALQMAQRRYCLHTCGPKIDIIYELTMGP